MLKALGLLLVVFSAEAVVQWLVGLFEGRLVFEADLLVLLIGVGLFYAHPLWGLAARAYVVLCGLALIAVTALAFAGFPNVGNWLEFMERDTLDSIPPPFIALYAATLLALLAWSYIFLHKAARADKDVREVSE